MSGIDTRFIGAEHGDSQYIRTPYLYPDGDNIDLFCKAEGDAVTVTDIAETAGWLRMQSVAARRPPEQNRIIDEVCAAHGVEFRQGMFPARCRSVGEISRGRSAGSAGGAADLWPVFPCCKPSRRLTVMDGRKQS